MPEPYKEISILLQKQRIPNREISINKIDFRKTFAEHNLSLNQGAKSLVLKGDDKFFLAVLAGDRKIDLKKAKQVFKTRQLRLATNEEIISLMGCEIGSCYPIGNIIGLTTYVDTSLSKNDTVFFNPGVADKWVILSWENYTMLTNPEIINIAA